MDDKNKQGANWYGGPDGNQKSPDANQNSGEMEDDEFYSEIPRDRNKTEEDQGTKEQEMDEDAE